MPSASSRPSRRLPRLAVIALALVGALIGATLALASVDRVDAASQGTGFGTWAPRSAYGWHGSMLIGGVHTYCILPGRDLPVGASTDNGISATAAGLGPAQLTGINYLVSTYGQTTDPVQAAAVGWAVKAIANHDETLHAFGYPGNDLRGAINWTFSALAPDANRAVQDRAEAYYAEATALPAGAVSGDGAVVFTTDAADPAAGTVAVTTTVAGATGTLTLTDAVFADTGSASRDRITAGTTYPIRASAPPGAAAFRVSGRATLTGGFTASVHHFSTPGGQDTAGPAGRLIFEMQGADAADRTLIFAPAITTQVSARYATSGAFVDDVTFATTRGAWPRAADGRAMVVAANATVYRTASEPELADAVPPDAVAVGALTLSTDPDVGATSSYRVSSKWTLAEPGFYTAVWTIDAADQDAAVRSFLDPGYRFVERFGEQSQLMMVPALSSAADPSATVGAAFTDVVVVAGPVPREGLAVSTAVYRAADGVAPADTCTPDRLVWASTAATATEPGRYAFTAPAVPDFGTYYWQERAVDAEGRVVHIGACGVESETTRTPLPEVTTRATSTVGLGGEMVDIAIVTGPVPQSGRTALTFELYRSPGGAEPAGACTPENLAASTSDQPVVVTAAGEVTSPGVRVDTAGTYWWVESLWWTPEGGDTRLLARGACGVENERTVVERPEVTTRADERVAVGEDFADTATVTGLGGGPAGTTVDAELIFFAYRTEPGAAPSCTAETLAEVTAPVAVPGSGTYRSPNVRADRPGSWHWIALLQYVPTDGGDAVVLARGMCGDAGETTLVSDLAATGAGGVSPVVIAGAGIAVLGGGVIVLLVRRASSRRRFGASSATG